MTFICKSCGTQLRIKRNYGRRGSISVILIWFIVTLAASFFPFNNALKVVLYLIVLFAAISLFNLTIPFEEVEQDQEQNK